MTFMLSGVTGTVALWYFYHRISKLIEFLLSEPIKNAFETATRPSALGKLACRTQDVILTDQESKREIEKSYGKLTKWRQRPLLVTTFWWPLFGVPDKLGSGQLSSGQLCLVAQMSGAQVDSWAPEMYQLYHTRNKTLHQKYSTDTDVTKWQLCSVKYQKHIKMHKIFSLN